MPDLYPQFPLYIPSKGRHEYMMTSKALTKMGVRHSIVVEPQEVDAYKASVKRMGLLTTVIELDMEYKKKYELCDDLGLTKSTGSGPARNFIWDHSISQGAKWHWIMDDNIKSFWRFNKSRRWECVSPAFWRVMEDFVLRYKNVSMAGPAYEALLWATNQKIPPFITNSRIYSCNLIRNDVNFRWRGRYNEDTILSLDMLKAGWCTIEFYAFLQKKLRTQLLKGGNTDELYAGTGEKNKHGYAVGGTDAKSEMLYRMHPDVTKIVWRFGRAHHLIKYSAFRKNTLHLKDGIVADGINEYGMTAVKVKP